MSVCEAQPVIAKTKMISHNPRHPKAFMENERVVATKADSRPAFSEGRSLLARRSVAKEAGHPTAGRDAAAPLHKSGTVCFV